MKTTLLNAVGMFQLKWGKMRSKNPLPGARRGHSVQSCAYDAEVHSCARCGLTCMPLQVMSTMLEALLCNKVACAKPLWPYKTFPNVEADINGSLFVMVPCEEPHMGLT